MKKLGFLLVLLLLVALPALAPTQTPGERLGEINKKISADLKTIDAQLDRIDRRLEVAFQDKAKAVKRGRGYKKPSKEVSTARHAQSDAKHGAHLKRLPRMTMASYDWRQFNIVGSTGDQGSCGNCYGWATVNGATCQQYKNGTLQLTATSWLSVQSLLDCHPELGGCDGGDPWEVAGVIVAEGLPSVDQYPGAGQSPGQCKNVSKPYKIVDKGFCDVGAGPLSVASTQSMKDCLVSKGPLVTCVAAGAWDDPGAAVMVGIDPNVDHVIIIVGWKTGDNGKTIWICQNQWSNGWGDKGFCYIEEGSFSVGFEVFWMTATSVPTPPPGPQPIPPPVSSVTITLTAEQVAAVQAQLGGTVTITASTTLGDLLDLLQKGKKK